MNNQYLYIAAEEAFYDDEKQLWGAYVGQGKDKKLRYTAWATTQSNAVSQAKLLAERLNGQNLFDNNVT